MSRGLDRAHGVLPYQQAELEKPFQLGGPAVHVRAVRALAGLRGRRPQLRRRDLPDDGSFDALVDARLIDSRGRLIPDGIEVVQALTGSPVRIRVQAWAVSAPLVLEAHLFGGRALVLATPTPSQYLGSINQWTGVLTRVPSPRVTLAFLDLDDVPAAIARWTGMAAATGGDAEVVFRAGWEQLQVKFTNDLSPDWAMTLHGLSTEELPRLDEPGMTASAGAADPTRPIPAEIWNQPWCGWAINTEPSSSAMTVIMAGPQNYWLTKPGAGVAELSPVSPVTVWNEIVAIVHGIVLG